MKVKKMTMVAIIAAIYTVLTLVLMNFGFGQIQIRIAEVLSILCVYRKDYIGALTLGCFLANLFGILLGFDAIGYLDLIFGTLATFIACVLMYQFRNILWFNKPIVSYLMPAIINGLIIGLMLAYILMPDNILMGWLINGIYVFVGEVIAVLGLGIVLDKPIKLIDSMVKFD